MEPKMEGMNNIEKKEMNPVEILKYMEKIGKDFQMHAVIIQAMIEEAREKNIQIDLSKNETLKKFAPLGEYEVMLIKLASELGSIKSDLYTQGVKMTGEDMNNRLEKMEK